MDACSLAAVPLCDHKSVHSGVLRLKSLRLDEEDMEGLGGSPERPSSPVSQPSSPRAAERCVIRFTELPLFSFHFVAT